MSKITMGKMSSKVKIHRREVHFATTFRKLRNQIFVSYIDVCYAAEQRYLSLSSELYIYIYIYIYTYTHTHTGVQNVNLRLRP